MGAGMKLGGWFLALAFIVFGYHGYKFFTTPLDQRPGYKQAVK
jgi:hypothetical protein